MKTIGCIVLLLVVLLPGGWAQQSAENRDGAGKMTESVSADHIFIDISINF
jgi:hypothetical protein